jgi:hypothetical protein
LRNCHLTWTERLVNLRLATACALVGWRETARQRGANTKLRSEASNRV